MTTWKTTTKKTSHPPRRVPEPQGDQPPLMLSDEQRARWKAALSQDDDDPLPVPAVPTLAEQLRALTVELSETRDALAQTQAMLKVKSVALAVAYDTIASLQARLALEQD